MHSQATICVAVKPGKPTACDVIGAPLVVQGLSSCRVVPALKASGDITSVSQADGYIEIPTRTDIRRGGRDESK